MINPAYYIKAPRFNEFENHIRRQQNKRKKAS